MRYLVGKSVQRFWANRKRYAFVILQIMIGTSLVALALHIRFSFQEQFRAFQEVIYNPYVNITGNNPSSEEESLTAADYAYIKEHLNPVGNGIAYYKECSLGDAALKVLFVDDAFFPIVMGAEGYDANAAYIGENARQTLNELLRSGQSVLGYDSTHEALFGVPVTSFLPLSSFTYSSKSLLTNAVFSVLDDVQTFEDYVIFPLSAYEASELPFKGWNNLVLSLTGSHMESLQAQIKDISAYLTEQYGDANWYIDNYYTYTEGQFNRNVHVAELLNFLSAFVLVIVVFGFAGLLLILLNKRRREFSIALMCGATSTQISREVFLEILYVVMLGVLLGNVVCLPLLPMLDSGTGLAFHLETLLLCIAGGLAVSVFVCAVALRKVRRLSPVVILKDL